MGRMISRALLRSFVLAIAFVPACSHFEEAPVAPADAPPFSRAAEDAAVRSALDRFHAAAAAADLDGYIGSFAPEGVFLGTDATERWTVEQFRAFCEPYFRQGRGWKYEPVERHVEFAEDGEVAWFDERLWNDSYGETRGTGVLRRTDGAWRIAQYNLTFTIPNDSAKRVVDLLRAK